MFLNILGRLKINGSFILSNLNYFTWHFVVTKHRSDGKLLEKALIFVDEDYDSSYEDFFLHKTLLSLNVKNLRAITIETLRKEGRKLPEGPPNSKIENELTMQWLKRKKTNIKIMVYNTQHRKLKSKIHKPHQNWGLYTKRVHHINMI